MTISDLPAKYQAEAYRQLGQAPAKPLGMARAQAVGSFPVEVVPTPSPRGKATAKPIRQRTGPKMNGLESAFYEYLKATYPGAQVLAQSVTLILGNGVRFTPDFVLMTDATNGHYKPVVQLMAFETKGFMRDDAAVKLKVAASLYPLIVFHLVTRPRKGGAWQIDQVYP